MLLRLCNFFLLLVNTSFFFKSVRDFRFWKYDSPKSELAYLRKFEGLLDVIMNDTELILLDGESECVSSKNSIRSTMEEEGLHEFGRRIGLLVDCSRLNVTVERCSIEFKKEDASNTVVMQQQSKNVRINSCILSRINSLTKDTSNQLLSFDFVGNTGCMTQMFSYEDVLVSQNISTVRIATDIFEFDSLRSSLKHLYMWKLHLLKLSASIIKSLYNNKRKYSLVEAYEEGRSSSPRPIPLRDVCFTA